MTVPDEREAALRSLAAGLDIPPDILTDGLPRDGLVGHWSEVAREEAERLAEVFRRYITHLLDDGRG